MVPNSDGVTVEVGVDGAVEIRAIDVDPDGLEAGEYVELGRPKNVWSPAEIRATVGGLPPKFRARWKWRCRGVLLLKVGVLAQLCHRNASLARRRGACPPTGKISLSGESDQRIK